MQLMKSDLYVGNLGCRDKKSEHIQILNLNARHPDFK